MIRGHKSIGERILSGHHHGVNNFIGAVIGAAASLIGSKMASKSNKQAAATAAEASDKDIALRREGLEFVKDTQAKIDKRTAPALDYIGRLVAAPPAVLTPEQARAREAILRSSSSQLNRSGLGGSGRAKAAVLGETDARFMDKSIETNRRRGDVAASGLAGPYFTSNMNTASNVNNALAGIGTVTNNAGITQANAKTASGQIRSDAIGTIGGIIANEVKSSYKPSIVEGEWSSMPSPQGGAYDYLP